MTSHRSPSSHPFLDPLSASVIDADGLARLGFSESDSLHLAAREVPYLRLRLPADLKGRSDLWLRRDDLIDPFESGNKRYKLHYNLAQAQTAGAEAIASFGGAWSNHLYALAGAGKRLGLNTHGIIRGELDRVPSIMLEDLRNLGMQLHGISREAYRAKAVPDTLPASTWLIPEGGNNIAGALGMQAVGAAISSKFGPCRVALAVGTGASLAGVSAGLCIKSQVWGLSVLKGEGALGREIAAVTQSLAHLLDRPCAPWGLIHGYHAGGYGRKLPAKLIDFMHDVEALNPGLLLDPVYTLKLLWGVNCLLAREALPRGRPLVLVHTGGLQGRRGFGWPPA